jgi:hypothetical protein
MQCREKGWVDSRFKGNKSKIAWIDNKSHAVSEMVLVDKAN